MDASELLSSLIAETAAAGVLLDSLTAALRENECLRASEVKPTVDALDTHLQKAGCLSNALRHLASGLPLPRLGY